MALRKRLLERMSSLFRTSAKAPGLGAFAGLLAAAAGVSPTASATSNEVVPEPNPPTIEERIAAVRKAFAEVPDSTRPAPGQKLSQWYNFPNYWQNWPNYWRNW